jgi:FKBP-type peptidyl-prolyl cis-trans isomerase (trigger factor)
MRYTMKNSHGQVLANERASFLYGSGEIIPGLEAPLTGLMTGEQRSFSLSPDDSAQLEETFHFDVTIDDVCWPSASIDTSEANNCPPDCAC